MNDLIFQNPSPGIYNIKLDLVSELSKELNLPEQRIAEILADEIMKFLAY